MRPAPGICDRGLFRSRGIPKRLRGSLFRRLSRRETYLRRQGGDRFQWGLAQEPPRPAEEMGDKEIALRRSSDRNGGTGRPLGGAQTGGRGGIHPMDPRRTFKTSLLSRTSGG